MLKRIAVLFILACPALAQVMGFNVGGRVIASQYGLWQAQTTNSISAGTQTIFLDRCYVTAGNIAGKQFIPWATNAPLVISDQNTETVTPTHVQTPLTGFTSCSVTAVFTKPHGAGATVYSGTFGLDEALNDTAGGGNPNGGVVVLDPTWLGTNAMITGFTGGNSSVFIEDLRNGGITYWKWNGAAYSVFVININVFGTGAKVASTDLVSFPTTNNCVIWLANGRLGDAGAGCGIGSVSGTQNVIAKIGAGGASAGNSDINNVSGTVSILNSAIVDLSGAASLKLPAAVPNAGNLGVVSNLLHVNLNGTDKTVATIDGVVGSIDTSLPWLTTTGAGPLAIAAASGQAANKFLASPNGAPGAITLRSILTADLPAVTVFTNQPNSWSSGAQTFGAGATLVATGADHTSPAKSGTTASKPGTCATGELYFATDATAGQNLFFCTAPNTFTQMSGGGGNPIWNTVQAPAGNQSLSMTTFTTAWTFGNTTTNTPFSITFGALSGSPSTAQFSIKDTTGSTGTGPLLSIATQGTSTAAGAKIVTASSSAVPLTLDCGASTCTALTVLNGAIAQTGTGTPSLVGTFGNDVAVPSGTQSGIEYGPTGLIKASYAGSPWSPILRQTDVPGTYNGASLVTISSQAIPDLSGTYVTQAQINAANNGVGVAGVAGLDANGNLNVGVLDNVVMGTTIVKFTAGDYGASPSTAAYSITDTSTTSTDTTPNFVVDSGANSFHIPFKVRLIGVDQLQVVRQPGPQAEFLFGSSVSPANIGQTPFAKVVEMSSTASHSVLRLFQQSALATGIMEEFNNASAAGVNWFFAKYCAGASSTSTLCASGTVVASLRGDGLFTTTNLNISSITGVAGNCLQADTSGNITGTGGACGGAGSTPHLDQVLDLSAGKTFVDGNFPLVFNSATTTNSQAAFTFGETSAATGTSDILVQLSTLSGSTAIPLRLTQGAGVSGAAAPLAISATGGAGGAAANTTSAGNTGGGYSWTAGAGSAGGATSGTGGAGGAIAFTTGAGGAATVGSTNGTGGNFTISLGAKGAGGSGGANGQFQVSGGQSSFDLGTRGLPSIIFGTDGAGLYRNAANQITYATGGTNDAVTFSASGVEQQNAGTYSFSSTGQSTGAVDSGWRRRAAGEVSPCSNANCNDAAGFIYGTTNKVFVAADFTTAANTSLQTITGLTISPASTQAHSVTFHCSFNYSQATANVAVAFGIQAATNAPTNIGANGTIWTSTTAATSGTLTGLNTTTATNVVSATPSATATVFKAELDGTFELAASANTFNVMVSTANASDLVTVKRGSYCTFF